MDKNKPANHRDNVLPVVIERVKAQGKTMSQLSQDEIGKIIMEVIAENKAAQGGG